MNKPLKYRRPMHYLNTLSLGSLAFAMLLQAGCFSGIIQKEYEAPTGFLLGPEDLLEITVWGNKDLTRITPIRPDGLISMPLIGDVQAAGLTADALASKIGDRLKQYLAITPSVSVAVKELNSYSVYVLGEVAKPGKFQLKSYVTVLQAISMAGGFTPFASKNSLQVVRVTETEDHKRHQLYIPVRYDDLLNGRGSSNNIVLLPGDTVVVP